MTSNTRTSVYSEIVATYRPALARIRSLAASFQVQWLATDRSRTAACLNELELELLVLDNYASAAEREQLSERTCALVDTSIAKIEALFTRRPFRIAPALSSSSLERAALEEREADFLSTWIAFRKALASAT